MSSFSLRSKDTVSVEVDLRIKESQEFERKARQPSLVELLQAKHVSADQRANALKAFVERLESDENETVLKYYKAQEKLDVLEFDSKGGSELHKLKREEILLIARSAVPNSKDADTISEQNVFKLKQFKGTLRHRDTRMLEKSFSDSKDPALVVRRHAIVVNLPPIRCLILWDRCLLLLSDETETPLATFMSRLRRYNMDNNDTFELRALEATFATVSSVLQQAVDDLKPRVNSFSKEKVAHMNAVSLNELRDLKSSVSKLSSRIQGIQHAYTEILDNDKDMALMKLTSVHKKPNLYTDENEALWEPDHDEVELLVENYLQSVDGTFSQAKGLSRQLESATSVLMIRLDTARNRLLQVELMVATITCVAAVGAVVAGIFGMNLNSGVESEPFWFWSIAGVVLIGTFVFVALMFMCMRSRGLLIG